MKPSTAFHPQSDGDETVGAQVIGNLVFYCFNVIARASAPRLHSLHCLTFPIRRTIKRTIVIKYTIDSLVTMPPPVCLRGLRPLSRLCCTLSDKFASKHLGTFAGSSRSTQSQASPSSSPFWLKCASLFGSAHIASAYSFSARYLLFLFILSHPLFASGPPIPCLV